MGVPAMYLVDGGLTLAFLGGGLLLLVALWWSFRGNGVALARDGWPVPVRLAALGGWVLWVGGLALQVLGHFGMVGVATWP
ncbi:MAG: hypothetical protein DMD79_25170 [Candidatus Rokuibacteriota bacterium]|nr:MAG: hypothetical protein DMD79_25170 [Candidatus Rokubacteria bacterium]